VAGHSADCGGVERWPSQHEKAAHCVRYFDTAQDAAQPVGEDADFYALAIPVAAAAARDVPAANDDVATLPSEQIKHFREDPLIVQIRVHHGSIGSA
jgi:hypothetical protein